MFQVVFGSIEPKTFEAQRPLIAVEGEPNCFRQTVRRREPQGNGILVDLDQFFQGLPFAVNRGRDFRIILDVFPPEDHIIHAPRNAVRPLESHAEVQSQLGTILIPFPTLGQARLHRIAGVLRPTQHGIVVDTTVAVEVIDATPRTVPDATILADFAIFKTHYARVFRQTVFNRRKFPRRHLPSQHGCFFVLHAVLSLRGRCGIKHRQSQGHDQNQRNYQT